MSQQQTFPAFLEGTIRKIEERLSEISELSSISWEFSEDDKGREILIVEQIDNGHRVTFTRGQTAMAFLDAYLLGYSHGRDDKGLK